MENVNVHTCYVLNVEGGSCVTIFVVVVVVVWGHRGGKMCF